jgi:hypothetical protein
MGNSSSKSRSTVQPDATHSSAPAGTAAAPLQQDATVEVIKVRTSMLSSPAVMPVRNKSSNSAQASDASDASDASQVGSLPADTPGSSFIAFSPAASAAFARILGTRGVAPAPPPVIKVMLLQCKL